MKKISTVVVVCIISTQMMGQTKTKRQPPPPPVAPVEMTAPTPPLPPPPPPVPPTLPYNKVNSKGYSISIKTVDDKTTIKVKKGGFSEMVPLEKWNANKAFYEKRYGTLPPPPPVPAVEQVNFTPPVIVKDKEN